MAREISLSSLCLLRAVQVVRSQLRLQRHAWLLPVMTGMDSTVGNHEPPQTFAFIKRVSLGVSSQQSKRDQD